MKLFAIVALTLVLSGASMVNCVTTRCMNCNTQTAYEIASMQGKKMTCGSELRGGKICQASRTKNYYECSRPNCRMAFYVNVRRGAHASKDRTPEQDAEEGCFHENKTVVREPGAANPVLHSLFPETPGLDR
jgi:hypothetical protein